MASSSALREEWTTSFALGMNDSKAATSMSDREVSLLLNYRVTPDGQAEVRKGSQKTHTVALNAGAQGYGGIEFRTAAGTVQWCVFVGDKMYTSTNEGVTWTQRATALRTDYWSLVTMRVGATNYLLCANGGASSYSWDGATWAAIANIDANVKLLAVHNERVWSYASGVTVKASKISDFSTWASPDGLSLPVVTHDGDNEVTGMFSSGSSLFVFKRNSIAAIDGFGESSIVVATGARGVSRDVGCIAFRSVAAIAGGGVAWLSERGFEFMTPGSAPDLISSPVESFMKDIAWADIAATPGLPQAIFYPRTLTYECALPGAGTQNNYTFVYRIPTLGQMGAVSLFSHGTATGYTLYADSDGYLNVQTDATRSQARTVGGYLSVESVSPGLFVNLDSDGYLGLATNVYDPAAIFVADRGEENQAPIGIGYDGFVRFLDYGASDDLNSSGASGTDIGARLLSRPMLFRDPFRKKRGRAIRALAQSDQGATVTLALLADGSRGSDHTATLGAAIGDQPKQVRANVNGRGRTLQVEVRTSKAGLKLANLSLAAELLKERL